MPKNDTLINDYHQNMFDFDRPNAGWVKCCAGYLDFIFPSGFKGKRIIDYGFGRGNWSLAFLENGAEHVTAIDASTSAVERFSQFAKNNGIGNISVQVGNSDEGLLEGEADVIFLYGILHHVEHPLRLLESASRMCASSASKVIVYSYNANSLRQTIVEIGRAAVGSEPESVRKFALTLHPDARIRALDDLTAPNVSFWTNLELEKMLQKASLRTISQLADFAAFEGKTHAPEFEPYVLVASPSDGRTIAVSPQCSPNLQDLEHIKFLACAVLKGLKKSERLQFAIGLFNTSFAVQGANHYYHRVFAIWRYLVIVGLSIGSRCNLDTLPVITKSLFDATYYRHSLTAILSKQPKQPETDFSLASLINRGGFRL